MNHDKANSKQCQVLEAQVSGKRVAVHFYPARRPYLQAAAAANPRL